MSLRRIVSAAAVNASISAVMLASTYRRHPLPAQSRRRRAGWRRAVRGRAGRRGRAGKSRSRRTGTGSGSDPVTAASGPTLAAGTIVLSAASIAAITSVTPTTVVFTSPPAQVSGLAVGNIIAVEHNSNPLTAAGLLRKIDQIATSGSTVTLTTSEAPLEEAFSTLDFTASGNDQNLPNSDSAADIHMVDPNFQAYTVPQVKIPLEKTFNIDLVEKLTKDPKEKARLAQNPANISTLDIGLGIPLEFTLSADLEKPPNANFWNRTFTYDFTAKITPKASIGATLGIAVKSETQRKEILTVEPSCFTVYLIVMCPKLSLYAQASVDGSIKFSFQASYEKTFGAQLTRDVNGKQDQKDLTTDGVPAFKYDISAAAKLTFSFPIAFQILIYKLAGPELEVTPSLELNADTTANPWLTVSLRAKVRISLLLDLTFAKFEVGVTILDKSFPIYRPAGRSLCPTCPARSGARRFRRWWAGHCDPQTRPRSSTV